MNIQKVCSAKFNIPNYYAVFDYNTARDKHFGIKLSQPLKTDTVSFQARGKKLLSAEAKAALARQQARLMRDAKQIEEANNEPTKKMLAGDDRTWGISMQTARLIPPMVEDMQRKVHAFLHDVFGGMIASEAKPDNLLLRISDRPKSALSIQEKSASRKFNSIDEILDPKKGMTDVNGGKTVMNYKTGKAEAEKVIASYIPLINTGQVRIREIELQLPKAIENSPEEVKEEFSYVSNKFLDELEDAQERILNGLENNPEKIILVDRPLPKYTKGNYCALHLLVELVEDASKPITSELRWTRPFEHQLMGPRVDKGKKLDDKWFKFSSGKEIGEDYAELKKPWEILMADENQAAKEEYIKYNRAANFQLRKDEMQEAKTKKIINRNGNLYITPRDYNLTPEYDLNVQYKIMQDCEQKAERAKKLKEQAELQAKRDNSKAAEVQPNEKKEKKVAKAMIVGMSKPIELRKTYSTKNTVNKEINRESIITPEEIHKLIEKFSPSSNKAKKRPKNNPNLKSS